MLPPDARVVLTEAMRPPPGAELARAVALTFTLDLGSALVVPLAFAANAVRESNDPLAVMESIRSCADRVDIFCQAGQIVVPAQATDLHAFLEKMVHPVGRPLPGCLFHPKLWALRFWDDANEIYLARLLVLSRNLTADRSWDTCLRLEGVVGSAPRAGNKPIADLIRHSMALAVDLPDDRRMGIEELIEGVRRTVWELPEGVENLTFHALGVPAQSRPDFSGSRHLMVAPFCNVAGVDLTVQSDAAVIVSRQEDLDRLPDGSLDGHEVFVVSELAGIPDEGASPSNGLLAGLHAKVYVVERGWGARMFVGSANATDAAFGGNVELLVELAGKRKSLGIDSMVAEMAPFRRILEPYSRQPPVEADEDEWRLENFIRAAAEIALTAAVQTVGKSYSLQVTSDRSLPEAVDLRLVAELLTRRGEAVELSGPLPVHAEFAGLSIVDITPFVALTARDGKGNSVSTVVRATLVGDPQGRLDEILARQVDTPEKFLRFLALMLGLGAGSILPAAGDGEGGQGRWTGVSSPGVLEMLMRALVDQPEQLDDLARLVARLQSTERGRGLLPAGFSELWKVVDEVRRDLAVGVVV